MFGMAYAITFYEHETYDKIEDENSEPVYFAKLNETGNVTYEEAFTTEEEMEPRGAFIFFGSMATFVIILIISAMFRNKVVIP